MRCKFDCKKHAVAKCTQLRLWHVCEDHMLPAAANGFYPRYLGSNKVMTPEDAATLVKAMEAEEWTHTS